MSNEVRTIVIEKTESLLSFYKVLTYITIFRVRNFSVSLNNR